MIMKLHGQEEKNSMQIIHAYIHLTNYAFVLVHLMS